MNIGTSDSAPKFDLLVQDIAAFVSKNTTSATAVDMHEYNPDWDVIYPFSAVGCITSHSLEIHWLMYYSIFLLTKLRWNHIRHPGPPMGDLL